MNNALSDSAIREQALDPRLCCVVQAPAGSGKTELLIQRILVLLAEVERPEEILAITFTKKAAGEMRSRVLKALREAEHPLPEDAAEHLRRQRERARAALARDRERGWNLLQQPTRLGIQTIDALCASLAARLPLTAGFGAPGVIGNEPELLYLEAATQVLTRIESAPDVDDEDARALEILLAHLGNDLARVRELLARMLGKRDQWLRHVMRGERAELEGALQRLVEDELRALDEMLADQGLRTEIMQVTAILCANLTLNEVDDNDPRLHWEVCRWPRDTVDELPRWQGLADHLLTNDGAWRKSVTIKNGVLSPSEKGISKEEKAERTAFKSRFTALLDGLREQHPELADALHACRGIPAPRYAEGDWQVLDALLRLLRLAVAELHLVFAAQGTLDFIENALAAQRALGDDDEASDLWLALDYRLRHILIDEFQDTSTTQFELLKRLTAGWQAGETAYSEQDGRSLFLVGDPMQSIYRFREAEVGLFLLAQREGVGALKLKPLELSTNFRSQAGIVGWVNRVFPHVLAPKDDLNEGAVRYAEPAAAAFHPEAEGAAVQLHLLPKPGKATDAEAEANPLQGGEAEAAHLVTLLRKALASLDHDGEHLKPADRSVAILVRSRSHLARIIPALRGANIAFQAVEIEQLADQPMIHDLMALTRALLHPADRIAWLAVLRAPWCGLTLADLHALVEGGKDATLWQLMHDEARLDQLAADARVRLLHLRHVLAAALAERGRTPLRRQVEAAWLALGGPACVRQASELREADIFFELLDALHDEQGGEIEAAELERQLTRLFAPPDAAPADTPDGETGNDPARVQLMTIHKSKGLQFHSVILPALARTPRNADSPLLVWREYENPSAPGGQPDLLLAPIKAAGEGKNRNKTATLYSWLQGVESARERHESGRLLYVAATRAIQRLHLLAECPADKEGAWNPPARSLLGGLWPGIEFMLDDLPKSVMPSAPARAADETGETGTPAPGALLRRLKHAGLTPHPPQALDLPSRVDKRETPSSHASDTPAAAQVWHSGDETPRHVGALLHRLLERIALEGLQRWDAARLEAARPALRRELLRLGVAASRADDALAQIARALENTLADARGRWILDAHEQARCEWALGGQIDGRSISAVIDRSFVEDGVRWIIDYKTAAPNAESGESMEAFLDRQQALYRAQLETYAAMLRQADPSKDIRLGLYFPALGAWRSWSCTTF